MIDDCEKHAPGSNYRQYIIDLAARHNVVHVRTKLDDLAETITRLSGDDVKSDEINDLLVSLKKSGIISAREMSHADWVFARIKM